MTNFSSSTRALRFPLVALTLVAAATAAQAGSITYNATVPQQLTDLSEVAVAPPLPEYNLGNTLTSVVITIQGNGETTFVSIVNSGASSTNFIGTATTSLFLDDPTSAGIDSALGSLTANISGSSPGTIGVHNVITGGQSVAAHHTSGPFGPYTMSGSLASETIVDPTVLALFQGPVGGNADLDFVLSTASGFVLTTQGTNNLTAVTQTDAGAAVSITYNYNGIAFTPEPDTLLLFGTGLLGLAGLVRFKAKAP